jgi:hypothetical protein
VVVEAWLYYTIAGLLGGLASALIWARGWEDLKAFEFFRAVALGAIGGFVFFLAHSEWNLPNSVVAFLWGYSFKDIIEGMAETYRVLRGSR